MKKKDAVDTVAKIEAAIRALQEENRVARRQLGDEEVEPGGPPPVEETDSADLAEAEEGDGAPAPARAHGDPGSDAPDAPAPDAETHLRMVEAIVFAAAEPLDTDTIRARLPQDADVSALLARMQADYARRGVNLVRVAGKWRLQTAPDLADALVLERPEPRKLSQAARETLAIIAYHQPVTRAEIEGVRGVAVSKGTIDVLMEAGWVRPRGRRRAPGRPTTYATTETFLAHFGLESLEDLPGKDELKAAGLLDADAPDDFDVPDPSMPIQDELTLVAEDGESVDAAFHTDYLKGDEAGEP